jgi:hypothetical protein
MQTISLPMVFLGHGIGGIIIKDVSPFNHELKREETDKDQFFWKASTPDLRGFPSRWYEDLVNNTVGIIFLGTPHFTPENIADQENIVGLITRPPTSRRSKTIDRKLLDMDIQTGYVHSLSKEFHRYIRESCPEMPVLSIWDGRESRAMRVEMTKVLGRRWTPKKYVVCHEGFSIVSPTASIRKEWF